MAVPHNKRVADEVLVEAYRRLGSVHKVAKEVGLNHSSVHERLVRLGIERNRNPFTQGEIERLKREYVIFRDAGKLGELAASMGRDKTTICAKARQLGLTNQRHPKRWAGKWKYMTEDAARLLFEKFKASSLMLGQFCARYGYDELGFATTLRRFFPDEWDAVIESKMPRQTLYRYGRQFEYRVRDDLRNRGYFVLRSPRSSSPADLVAIKVGSILMVQCKRAGELSVKEWNELFDLAISVGAVPILAGAPSGRGVLYWRLVGRKDGSKRAQPREPFDP